MFQNDLIPSDLGIPKFHKNKKVVVMLAVIDRGSRLQMFIKIGVLKISQQSLENTYAGLKACNYIRKRLQNKCFPVNIAKFFTTAILRNTSNGCFWLDRFTWIGDLFCIKLYAIMQFVISKGLSCFSCNVMCDKFSKKCYCFVLNSYQRQICMTSVL